MLLSKSKDDQCGESESLMHLLLPYSESASYAINRKREIAIKMQKNANAEGPCKFGLSSFPELLMIDEQLGATWLHLFLSHPKGQSRWGIVENDSLQLDGTNKLATLLSLMGGFSDIVKVRMIQEGIYEQFIDEIS